MRRVLEQFGKEYTDSGMRKLLTRLDYRFNQPSLIPAKADPEAQAAWVETYAEKGDRNPARARVLFGCGPPPARRCAQSRLEPA
jgi:hypothetical protein